jgi:hypothetical protein
MNCTVIVSLKTVILDIESHQITQNNPGQHEPVLLDALSVKQKNDRAPGRQWVPRGVAGRGHRGEPREDLPTGGVRRIARLQDIGHPGGAAIRRGEDRHPSVDVRKGQDSGSVPITCKFRQERRGLRNRIGTLRVGQQKTRFDSVDVRQIQVHEN